MADFLPNWNFRGVFSPYIIYNAGGISAAAMAGDIIFFSLNKYDNKRAILHFRRFFSKLEFLRGFLYIILILPKGTAKLRWEGWERSTLYLVGCPVAH